MRAIRSIALRSASFPVLGVKLAEAFLRRRYGRRVVTRQKVANFLQAWRDVRDRVVEVRSLPYILNIGMLNTCNLACPFCPTGTNQLKRPKARMRADRARKVIDAVRSHVLEARLYNWGEPFLNPDIFEIIRYARDAGMYTKVSSNLSVAVDGLAERIIESGLDYLLVSMDGLDQETLEKYRYRVRCDRLYENISRLVAARARSGAGEPRIDVGFLVFRHNEHQVPRLKKMAAELGVDSFFPRQACIYHESFVPASEALQPVRVWFHDTCPMLYTELMVEADGAISPCCTNTDSKWDVGTIDDLDDLPGLWNSRPYQAMRARLSPSGRRRDRPGGAPEPVLCEYCGFVAGGPAPADGLSPVPASMVADGEGYRHGLDSA